MNHMALVTCALVLFSDCVSGATLNELINKNVRDATSAYEKTLPPAQQPANVAQLWVHIRRDSQNKLALEILDRVAKTDFTRWKVESKPVQKVDSGPRKNQLRYFKRQDKTQAQELFDMLRKLIPELEISDVSGKYESVGWIKPGHYELWLTPDLERLQPQR
jgi:capsule polysaccharide modification protein KpsS